jgi:hypothetical protein
MGDSDLSRDHPDRKTKRETKSKAKFKKESKLGMVEHNCNPST